VTNPMGGMGGWEMLRSMRRENDLSGRRVGRATAKRVFAFAKPYRREIVVFLLAVVLDAGIGVATPVLAGRVINVIGGHAPGAATAVVRTALFIACLAIADSMPMSRTRSARSPNRFASASGRPNSLTRSAPATPNRSVIVAFIFASSW